MYPRSESKIIPHCFPEASQGKILLLETLLITNDLGESPRIHARTPKDTQRQ